MMMMRCRAVWFARANLLTGGVAGKGGFLFMHHMVAGSEVVIAPFQLTDIDVWP